MDSEIVIRSGLNLGKLAGFLSSNIGKAKRKMVLYGTVKNFVKIYLARSLVET